MTPSAPDNGALSNSFRLRVSTTSASMAPGRTQTHCSKGVMRLRRRFFSALESLNNQSPRSLKPQPALSVVGCFEIIFDLDSLTDNKHSASQLRQWVQRDRVLRRWAAKDNGRSRHLDKDKQLFRSRVRLPRNRIALDLRWAIYLPSRFVCRVLLPGHTSLLDPSQIETAHYRSVMA
jgi:hypothetical protein